MPSQQEQQARFKELLERIGPGIRLEVDDVVLKAVFGEGLGERLEPAIEWAREFAQRNHCGCIYSPGDTHAMFIRAYFEPD